MPDSKDPGPVAQLDFGHLAKAAGTNKRPPVDPATYKASLAAAQAEGFTNRGDVPSIDGRKTRLKQSEAEKINQINIRASTELRARFLEAVLKAKLNGRAKNAAVFLELLMDLYEGQTREK